MSVHWASIFPRKTRKVFTGQSKELKCGYEAQISASVTSVILIKTLYFRRFIEICWLSEIHTVQPVYYLVILMVLNQPEFMV